MTRRNDTRITANGALGRAMIAAARMRNLSGIIFCEPEGLPFAASIADERLYVNATSVRRGVELGVLVTVYGEAPPPAAWDCATCLSPLGMQVARMLASGHAWVRLVDARRQIEEAKF